MSYHRIPVWRKETPKIGVHPLKLSTPWFSQFFLFFLYTKGIELRELCFHGSMSFAHDARTFAMSQMLKIKYDSMMAKPNVSRFFSFSHCTHEILFTFTQHSYSVFSVNWAWGSPKSGSLAKWERKAEQSSCLPISWREIKKRKKSKPSRRFWKK